MPMRYQVSVEISDGNWIATVQNLEGAHTFGENFAELNAHVREVISLIEDLPEGAEKHLVLEWFIDGEPVDAPSGFYTC